MTIKRIFLYLSLYLFHLHMIEISIRKIRLIVIYIYLLIQILGVIVISPTGSISGLFRLALLHKVPVQEPGLQLGEIITQ